MAACSVFLFFFVLLTHSFHLTMRKFAWSTRQQLPEQFVQMKVPVSLTVGGVPLRKVNFGVHDRWYSVVKWFAFAQLSFALGSKNVMGGFWQDCIGGFECFHRGVWIAMTMEGVLFDAASANESGGAVSLLARPLLCLLSAQIKSLKQYAAASVVATSFLSPKKTAEVSVGQQRRPFCHLLFSGDRISCCLVRACGVRCWVIVGCEQWNPN